MRTLQEIEACGKEILSVDDVAGYLGSHPQDIRITAHQTPQLLGFPFMFVGNRMKIPRDGFVRWAKGLHGGRST